MQPRQQRGQRRRDALVKAAAEIATERGYAAVSHRTVAHRAGAPLGSTTYYFSSLDDLLGAVAELMIEQCLARGAEQIRKTTPAPRNAATAAMLLARVILPGEDYAHILCYYEQLLGSARYPSVAAVLNGARPRLEAIVDDVLAITGYSGRVSPALVLAAVDGATLGALSEHRTDVTPFVTAVVTDLLDHTDNRRIARRSRVRGVG